MKALLLIPALILLGSCNKSSSLSHETSIKYDKQNTVRVQIIYDEPINGFDVNATCFVDTTSNYDSPNTHGNHNAIYGRGYIHFENDTMQFTVSNPLFSDFSLMDNPIPLANDVKITAKYTPYTPPSDDPKAIFSMNDSPFFFYDIDFDGEKELIVTLWEGMEYHGHNSFEVYKIRNAGKHEILAPMSTPPFNRLDDYTLVDPVARTISICKGIDAVKITGYDTYQIK